jgi:Tol biopolymer transport system component
MKVGIEGDSPIPAPNITWPISYYTLARKSDLMIYVPNVYDTAIDIISNSGRNRAQAVKPICQINSTLYEAGPSFSPDGSTIAFESNRTGWSEIWLARLDCTQLRQLTNFKEYGTGSPRWSPDGTRIVFDRREKNHPDIYTIGVNGNDLRNVTNSPYDETMPCWSQDGQWIYYTSEHPESKIGRQIWKIPAGGGEEIQVTQNGGYEPVVSPDGNSLYFTRSNHLFRMDLRSGEESIVPELAEIEIARYWDIGPNAIFYLPYNAVRIPPYFRLDLKTRKISTIGEEGQSPVPLLRGISVSADESKFALSWIDNSRRGDLMQIANWRQ